MVFTSLRPLTKDLELDLVVTSRDLRASAQTVVANPAFATQLVSTVSPTLPWGGWPAGIATLAFFAVGLLAGGVLLLVRPEQNTLGQLQFYEQLQQRGDAGLDAGSWDPNTTRGRLLSVASTLASKGGFEEAMRHELEAAGLPLRPVEYMTMHVSAVLGGGLLALFLTGGAAIPAIVTVVVLALGPIAVLRYLVRRRTEQFTEQLPDVLNLLASSLRAGWGLLQAIGIVVEEMPPPAKPEFARVVTEARLGIPLEQALEKMATRLDSSDFHWAVTAIGIQREVGGNLAEVLDTVANTVRERAVLRRQISSLTAEGRLSAVILIALPIVEAVVLSVINPGYMGTMLRDPLGLVAVIGAVLLLVVGGVWLVNIVRIEV